MVQQFYNYLQNNYTLKKLITETRHWYRYNSGFHNKKKTPESLSGKSNKMLNKASAEVPSKWAISMFGKRSRLA